MLRTCLAPALFAARFAALCVALFVAALPARAQLGGAVLPGVQQPVSAPGDGEGRSFGGEAQVRAAATFSDAGGLVGLKPPAAARTLTLADALARLDDGSADVRIAAERLVQAQANVRRAWSAFLPTLSVVGNYTLTCTGGGEDGLNCSDRTASFVDKDTIDQQATLFESIADLLRFAADNTQDPTEAEQLRTEADQLDAGAKDVRATDTTPVVVQPANVFSGGVNLTMPIFNGRAFPLLWNAYSGEALAGRAQAQVRAATRYAVTRGFLSAVAARRFVHIAEGQLDATKRHLEATRAKVETQTQPPLALARAELEALRAEQQLRTARTSYQTAIAAIGLTIGETEAFDVDDAQLSAPASLPADEQALVERALEHRPDLAAQRLSLEIAGRGELDAWAMFLPSVNLSATARGTSFTQGFVKDPITGTLSVTASLPLYDGGVRYAALRDSGSRLREEKIRTRQMEDRVQAQVRGNLADIASKTDAVRIATRAVEIAGAARDQAQALFDTGVGTALDVSDTSLSLFVAETDLVRAQLDLSLAQSGLAYVVGDDVIAAETAGTAEKKPPSAP